MMKEKRKQNHITKCKIELSHHFVASVRAPSMPRLVRINHLVLGPHLLRHRTAADTTNDNANEPDADINPVIPVIHPIDKILPSVIQRTHLNRTLLFDLRLKPPM